MDTHSVGFSGKKIIPPGETVMIVYANPNKGFSKQLGFQQKKYIIKST